MIRIVSRYFKYNIKSYIKKLESGNVEILYKKVVVQKEERNICFLVTICAREQIGINIPMEDVLKHEFEWKDDTNSIEKYY